MALTLEEADRLLAQYEQKIQAAQVEKSMHERRLNEELRPQRKALEDQCSEAFNCKPAELSSLLEQYEADYVKLIQELGAKLDAVQQPKAQLGETDTDA